MGKYLFMSGGKTSKNETLSDFWALDMAALKWTHFPEI
jgi:hypothetical protein